MVNKLTLINFPLTNSHIETKPWFKSLSQNTSAKILRTDLATPELIVQHVINYSHPVLSDGKITQKKRSAEVSITVLLC